MNGIMIKLERNNTRFYFTINTLHAACTIVVSILLSDAQFDTLLQVLDFTNFVVLGIVKKIYNMKDL